MFAAFFLELVGIFFHTENQENVTPWKHNASELRQSNQKLRKPKFDELIIYDKIFAEKAERREEWKRIWKKLNKIYESLETGAF